MKIKKMKEICTPLGIAVECRWGRGFQVSANDEKIIKDGLMPFGFKVKGIGIGRDYNRQCVIADEDGQFVPTIIAPPF